MASIENTIIRDIYDLAFQVSPIIFHNGIASKVPGGYLPVIALLGGLGIVQQVIVGKTVSLNDFSFRFRPMPGSTIINQAVGMYPFANQSVAANATIQEPLTVSLHMICPVFTTGGYVTKLPLISAMKYLMEKHNNEGGSYLILTPSHFYLDCLMLTMTDITSGETKQDQAAWQLDFIQPIVSVASAVGALSSLMSKVTNGQKNLSSSWSGAGSGIGNPMQGSLGSFGFGSSGSMSSLGQFIPGI